VKLPDSVPDRWPAPVAAVTHLVAPVITTRRTDHIPLWQAWLVHVFGLALIVAVSVALAAWIDAPRSASIAEIIARAWGSLRDVVAAVRDWEYALFIFGYFILIEAFTMLLALLATPWGARDEQAAETLRRTLQRMLLLTPYIATIVLITGSSIVPVERWIAENYGGGPWSSRPWWVRNSLQINVMKIVAALYWAAWAVLRVSSVGPRAARCVWPPLCERCGYPLTGVSRTGGCPECGTAVQESIGQDRRPGAAWQREPLGIGWAPTAITALIKPTRLAGQLRIWDTRRDHIWFLVVSLALMGLIHAVLVVGYTFPMRWHDPAWTLGVLATQVIVAAIWGAVLPLFPLGLVLLTASLLGAGIRRHDKRTLMPGSMRAACYASALFPLWLLLGWSNFIFVAWLDRRDLLYPIASALGADSELLVVGAVLLVHLGLMIAYVVIAGRITRRLVHVNR
jgi:hypothetical protein